MKRSEESGAAFQRTKESMVSPLVGESVEELPYVDLHGPFDCFVDRLEIIWSFYLVKAGWDWTGFETTDCARVSDRDELSLKVCRRLCRPSCFRVQGSQTQTHNKPYVDQDVM